MSKKTCFHCGLDFTTAAINFEEKTFCCNGCKTVYSLLKDHDLSCYYDLQDAPGAQPKTNPELFHFLDNPKIVEQLLEFNDDGVQIVNLYIPHIHCSSCIWVLENFKKLHPAVSSSTVNFGKKSLRITFHSEKGSLKEIVELLSRIGYEPLIRLDDYDKKKKNIDRSIIYKLGIAGFAFGNIMFLSFPEYFQVGEYWLEQYKFLFRWLMFFFALPVVFYAANDYFISAFKGLRSRILNIDVPIALGISVLFLRSTFDIIFNTGSGFFDSLSGLVFFLLLGKFFQQKTYSFLSFERDYKSYFPIGVTKLIGKDKEESIPVHDIQKGDILLIRHEELIPVDCRLLKGKAKIDYSFVTGESKLISKKTGDQLFAGGKPLGGSIEVKVLNTVAQSYLTQLWDQDVFNRDKTSTFTSITNRMSKYFTLAVLSIATIATTFWLFIDSGMALNVFTAVLIIACPCALALAAPFTFGNMLRIFGKQKFYLKNTSVIEQLAHINTVIFDKTGTLTSPKESQVKYEGMPLNASEKSLLKSSLRQSNHPLSRSLYQILKSNNIMTLDAYEEITGKGIQARSKEQQLKIGSADFVGVKQPEKIAMNTAVHIQSNEQYKGHFTFYNKYRKGMSKLFNLLKKDYDLAVLSGDNAGEENNLKKLLPAKTKLVFNQSPQDKLQYIKYHQSEGARVLMVGDGLNDAGALAQSNVGVAISEHVNVFSPACDAIMDASVLQKLYDFISLSKASIRLVKWSFLLSLLYNLVGLYFAVTGQLAPVIAAILMPLSSISVVVFTTIGSNILGKKLN
ncbi:heavy metal translocating P-type ATPase [Gaetbulibacter aestuarii]|uniref:Heavy metal translocating P-type ATPase metal-binding domain-containing protein n=1 Tax=Gaetbulibacter aestuarii TaxID=1502358 RepID=A0ABW7MXT8_9FLAO